MAQNGLYCFVSFSLPVRQQAHSQHRSTCFGVVRPNANRRFIRTCTPVPSTKPIETAQTSESNGNPWEQAATFLCSAAELSEFQADKVLRRAFGWGTQVYWKNAKIQQEPNLDQIQKTVAYLTEQLEMSPMDISCVLDLFPEVLGLSLEHRIIPNVKRIENTWNMQNPRLRNSILENPSCLGYYLDCEGSCIGECDFCWARF